jgi:putative endonuclease
MMTNEHHTVFYTGVTSDLEQRVFQHKTKEYPGFTARYNCNKLVYLEEFGHIEDAIKREKQLKRYRREWKENLIKKMNPEWMDLSERWYDPKSIFFGIEINKRYKK